MDSSILRQLARFPSSPCTRPSVGRHGFLSSFSDTEETCAQAAERRSKLTPCDLPRFVLVADDEPLIRSTIVEILRHEGYDAVAVKDGLEAIQCAQRLLPDVFLADVAMPGMSGVEAARKIRELSPATRVICFSGHSAISDLLAQASAHGHDFQFLSKPIKPDALIRAIRNGTA